MKSPFVALWISVLGSSFYAHSLSPAQVVSQNLTIVSNVTLGQQSCRSNYGTGLTLTSCANAWEKIPQDSESHTYGLRADIAAGAHLDVGLPVRYLSDDGLCAIDLHDKYNSAAQLIAGDSAKNIEVSGAAKAVLDQCVRTRHLGGTRTGFSQRGLLTVAVTKYEPKAVCEPVSEEIPFAPFCERVLQTMPARRQKDVFGFSKSRREPFRYYVLPRYFGYPETGPRCDMVVSKQTQFPYSKASWFDFWAAAVEVFTMCIQKGMPGSVHGLGDNQQLYVTIQADGGPLTLSNGCKSSGHCLMNTTFLAID